MDIVGTGDYPLEWIFKNLDYYQKKKAYDEHLFDPLRPKIFTVKQHLPNKKFNYFDFTQK